MRLIAISSRLEGADPGRIEALAADEARKAWELYARGRVRTLYFDLERCKGIVELECADRAEARAVLSELPLVQAGQIGFDIYALGPYTQLEALFAARPS
jgi:muconolactone delta-isomerase